MSRDYLFRSHSQAGLQESVNKYDTLYKRFLAIPRYPWHEYNNADNARDYPNKNRKYHKA
jgi:hypothetical protein